MIPTEPIGSIPRPAWLIEAMARGDGEDPALDPLYQKAVPRPIAQFEATGSPVITDGEQRKYHNFWTYCVHGLPNTAPDGFKIPFAAGHTRRMPRLTARPVSLPALCRRATWTALRYAHVPVKQAVISPSALSLMYPAEGIPGYPREQFIDDLLREHETEVRRCLRQGRAQRADRLHRGPARGEDRPVRPSPEQLHRSEQPRAVAVLAAERDAHRRAHLPGRRPRFDAQRRRRLRRAAAEPVRAQGGQLLRRAGGRDAIARACSRSSASA